MANVEKISIVLPPEMAAIVRQCVESGPGRLADINATKEEARQRLLSQDAEQH